MLRVKITVILLLGLLRLGITQGTNFQTQLQDNLPKIIPPSPDAAAIEKFGVIPVSYSTGVPNIGYPMWSWKRGKLSFDIGLSYHAGGHKVQDMASNVGLGWALNCGGRVSRTIRGVRDDHITRGYIYTPELPNVNTATYQDQVHYSQTIYGTQDPGPIGVSSSSDYSLIESIYEGWHDSQQDIFSYTIPGYSGRFLLSKNKQVVPLEYTNLKFEVLYSSYLNNNPNGDIIGFAITDDNGLVYKFDLVVWQRSEPVPASLEGPAVETVNSEWLLTEIKDPIVNEAISFTYLGDGTISSTAPVKYEIGFSQSQRYSYELVNPNGGITQMFHESSNTTSYSVVDGGVGGTPTSVNFPDGSSVSLEYDFTRLDLANGKALTKVIIKNMKNEIARQFQLSYTYFTAGPRGIWTVASSPNDFTKRLRLDQIDELSADGIQHKPTAFSYNATPLNPRDSRNLDYWGYNVNPARNNFDFVPKIRFGDPQPYFDFLPGGDLAPDETYAKAAILEKISYPTGGFTQFEFESNRIFSPVNYYENELATNTPEWQQAQFNQPFDLLMAGRTELEVTLAFKAEEFDPRPEPDPDDPITCFGQDAVAASFQIYSTDGQFSTTIGSTYGDFYGGTQQTVSLPLNKTYKVKFIYNTSTTCAWLYPFKTFVTGKYYITMEDKLAGGLRIKKIISDDGSGKTVIKEYDYNNPDGHSSAYLDVIPNYGYYKTSTDVTNYIAVDGGWESEGIHLQRHVNRHSRPTNTLHYANGAPILYARVKEKEVDGSLVEREYDPVAGQADLATYPNTPGQEWQNLTGLLTKETVKDNNGVIQSEKVYTYSKVFTQLTSQSNKGLQIGCVTDALDYPDKLLVVHPFWPWVSRPELTSTVSKIYENGLLLTQTETRSYDPNRYYLRGTETTNSKGETRATTLYYPFDQGGSIYSTMVQNNILSPVVHTMNSKGLGLNNGLSQSKTNYILFNGTMPFPATVQSSLLEHPLETDVRFNSYDIHGNITQYTSRDGVINSFIWGYKSQYPVAKIVGKSYSEAISQSGINLSVLDNPSNDAAMRAELDKLRALTGCFATTYTYKPLAGVTSETGPNGRTVYYEYDSYNRLSLIRDKDNNVIKKFCYKYDGQPVDCSGQLVWENKALSAQFTKSGCPAVIATYYVPQGKFTSTLSQQDADQQAQADLSQNGQAFANAQPCAPPVCNSATCTGEDKKCINGICETGVKVCTATVRIDSIWYTTFHYQWSDSSVSQDYTVQGIVCWEL